MPQVRIFQHREYPWWIVIPVLFGRFISGREMNGYRVTDATWTKHGLHREAGRPGWWGHLPYRTRTLMRLSVLTVLTLAPVGLWLDWQNTVDTLQIMAISITVVVLWSWFNWAFRKAHKTNYVRPLAYALAPLVGWSERKRADDWVHVPRTDHKDDPNRVTVIDLPEGFAATEQNMTRIEGVITRRLGIKSPTFTWQHSGKMPTLVVSAGTLIPIKVPYDEEIEKFVKDLPNDEFAVGKGKDGKVHTYSLNDESPHVALSMGSGAGKSVLVKLIAAQALYRGYYVYIGDSLKHGASHLWAKYIDKGVTTFSEIGPMCDSLEIIGQEVERRMREYYESDGKATFTPILYIFEEANLTMPDIQRHYRKQGNKSVIKDLPAIVGLTQIIQAGRQAQIYLVTVSQRFDAAVAGGGQARESYGIKLMGRYSKAAAKMLMMDSPYPEPSFHPGRVQLVLGAKNTELQVILMSDIEAQLLSVDGIECPPEPLGVLVGRPSDVSPGNHTPETWDSIDPEPDLITLSDAVNEGVVTMSLSSLRKASNRKGFPEAKGKGIKQAKMYERADLALWWLGRGG